MGGAVGLMPQQIQTSLMVGGLDLATPPIAMPPGRAIACINYEPDVAGYTSFGGIERFDGHDPPSQGSTTEDIALRRNNIGPVPGVDAVRGVWVFDGAVYAFRDQADGTSAGMFKATSGGWIKQTFGSVLEFGSGTKEFLEGEYVVGQTSHAVAWIDRVVLREGAWNGTANGYLIISNITGTFGQEVIKSTSNGSANGVLTSPINLLPGGRYDFTNHNFYGAASRARMYFVSGADTAYEWTGTVLSPIHTGQSKGGAPLALSIVYLHNWGWDEVTTPSPPESRTDYELLADDGSQIIMSALFDAPAYIAHYKNHLFLGFTAGTLLNSSLGEPLEYSTTTGAGEISFGEQITGLLSAAQTSLVVFAQNRIEYLTGDDSTTFVLNPLTEASGAKAYTAQMMDEPMYMDDAGVRRLSATAAFGDWKMGTLTQPVERLIRQKRDQNIFPTASVRIRGKDQYRLFWDDGTGITVYIGRKQPETLPFKLPVMDPPGPNMRVYCACAGEVNVGHGDRIFLGCQDGYVYEMNVGTSFDGAPIDSYIRLPFNAAGTPSQHTRWMKVTFEMETPDNLDIGLRYDVDYTKNVDLSSAATHVMVDHGAANFGTEYFATMEWLQPVEGRLEHHLTGIGPNVSTTLFCSCSTERQHTISSQTYNFSRRRLMR